MFIRHLLLSSHLLSHHTTTTILHISAHRHQSIILFGLFRYFRVAVRRSVHFLFDRRSVRKASERISLFLNHFEQILLKIDELSWLLEHHLENTLHLHWTLQILHHFQQKIIRVVIDLLQKQTIQKSNRQLLSTPLLAPLIVSLHPHHLYRQYLYQSVLMKSNVFSW